MIVVTAPNAPPWSLVLTALDKVASALGHDHAEVDAQRIQAELAAGSLLVRSGRLRTAALNTLLFESLASLTGHSRKNVLGRLAGGAIERLEKALTHQG